MGHVGYYLVRHLAQEGAKITVTDIDAEKIETVVKEFGVEVCGLDDIYDIDCDIYAPARSVVRSTTTPSSASVVS